MRIVLTGGGTAGHIMPHIAIIEEAKMRTENRELRTEIFEFLYIGSRNGMEKELIKSFNIAFKAIYTGKLRRYFSLENFLDFLRIPIGFFQSLYYLIIFKPDLVFSKGGYVSVPVVLAAFVLRKKIIVHESDFSPGLANKICSRFASLVLLSHAGSKKFFPHKKTQITGIPIRKFILNGDRSKAKKILQFSNHKPVLLIMGGSLGARAVNDVVFEVLDKILAKFNVIHITGKAVSCELLAVSFENYKAFEYVDKELPDFYALADVVVSRAGANSLAELASLHKKVLLIPLPKFASRGDQIENAEIFVKEYGGKILYQENLTGNTLLAVLDQVLVSTFKVNEEVVHLNAAAKILEIVGRL